MEGGNVMPLLANLDESVERISEEEVAEAMKAVKTTMMIRLSSIHDANQKGKCRRVESESTLTQCL